MTPQTKAKAYVQAGRLYVMGTSDGPGGMVPFLHDCGQLTEELPDGVIDFNKLPPSVEILLNQNEEKIASEIDAQQIKLAAEGVVTRARFGDQNAMALLVSVQQAAAKGNNPRAQLTHALMVDYAESHPFDAAQNIRYLPDVQINRQIVRHRSPTAITAYTPAVQNLYALAVLLADGELLTRAKLDDLLNTFTTEEEKHAFKLGVSFVSAPDVIANASKDFVEYEMDALKTGCCIGLARRLQIVRRNGPIGALSPVAAWELGE